MTHRNIIRAHTQYTPTSPQCTSKPNSLTPCSLSTDPQRRNQHIKLQMHRRATYSATTQHSSKKTFCHNDTHAHLPKHVNEINNLGEYSEGGPNKIKNRIIRSYKKLRSKGRVQDKSGYAALHTQLTKGICFVYSVF